MNNNPSVSTDPSIINGLIRTRRSVFTSQFEPGKSISDEIILQILENANCAPTHKLTEPWRFTVFTGEGLKTLAEKQAAIYKEFAGASFKQSKYEQLLTNPQLCSHVIAIGCKRHIGRIPEIEEIASVACAVENIYLSVHAYGLGGYWSTGGITFIDEAKSIFGLEDDDIFMGFFFLGYVKTPSVERIPGSLSEKISWVRE
jgi:nitroreductase